MGKVKQPFMKKALCPCCGGDSFRVIEGYRPSKLPDFDNGYPFSGYECTNPECGWKTAPWDDLRALDRYFISLLRGQAPEARQFKFEELPVPKEKDYPKCFKHFDDSLKCAGCSDGSECRDITLRTLFKRRHKAVRT